MSNTPTLTNKNPLKSGSFTSDCRIFEDINFNEQMQDYTIYSAPKNSSNEGILCNKVYAFKTAEDKLFCTKAI